MRKIIPSLLCLAGSATAISCSLEGVCDYGYHDLNRECVKDDVTACGFEAVNC